MADLKNRRTATESSSAHRAGLACAAFSILFLLGTGCAPRACAESQSAAERATSNWSWSPWVTAKGDSWLAFRSACTQLQKGQAAWIVELRREPTNGYVIVAVTASVKHFPPVHSQIPGSGAEVKVDLDLNGKNCRSQPEVIADEFGPDGIHDWYVYKKGKVKRKFGSGDIPGFWGSLALGLAAGMAGAAQAEQNQAAVSSAPASSPTAPSSGASYPSGQAQTASPGGGQLRNTCLSVFPKPIQSAAFPDIHAVVALHNHCNEALDVAAMVRNNSPGGGGGWCEAVPPAGADNVPPGGDISFGGSPHGWCAKANCADEPVVWNAMDAHYDSMNGTSPPYPNVPRSHKCGRVF